MNKVTLLFVSAIVTFSVACGSSQKKNGGNNSNQGLPTVNGEWEVIATSSNPPQGYAVQETRIETNLRQDASGNLSDPSPVVFGIQWSQGEGNFTSGPNYQIGGCGSTGTTGAGTNQIGGSVNANSQVTITLMEGAMTYNGTGTLNADGSISGTYSGGTSACVDSGTFVATRVPNGNLAGNYGNDSLGSSLALSITQTGNTLSVSGSSNMDGNFTLSGTSVGNAGAVSGTILGQVVTYYGLLMKDNANTLRLAVWTPSNGLVGVLAKK